MNRPKEPVSLHWQQKQPFRNESNNMVQQTSVFNQSNKDKANNNNNNSRLAGSQHWPPEVQAYVNRAFDTVENEIDKDRIQIVLRGKIRGALHDGTFHLKDWNTEPLPVLSKMEPLTGNKNPTAFSSFQNAPSSSKGNSEAYFTIDYEKTVANMKIPKSSPASKASKSQSAKKNVSRNSSGSYSSNDSDSDFERKNDLRKRIGNSDYSNAKKKKKM